MCYFRCLPYVETGKKCPCISWQHVFRGWRSNQMEVFSCTDFIRLKSNKAWSLPTNCQTIISSSKNTRECEFGCPKPSMPQWQVQPSLWTLSRSRKSFKAAKNGCVHQNRTGCLIWWIPEVFVAPVSRNPWSCVIWGDGKQHYNQQLCTCLALSLMMVSPLSIIHVEPLFLDL